MPDSFTVKIEGLDKLRLAMQQLPDKVSRRAVPPALRAGAAIVRDAAKAKAPVWHGEVSEGHPPPGTLRRNIVIKYAAELSTPGSQTYIVTVKHGKKYQSIERWGRTRLTARIVNLDAYYWTFVEFGTSKMPGTPFMRPAFNEKAPAASYAIEQRLAELVELEASKLARL